MQPNNLIFTVGEVAKILKVNKDLIKHWAYKFARYLGPAANPDKGSSRTFLMGDIRVMAFIYINWDDEPNIEEIIYGLGCNEHLESTMIDGLITEITPLFQDPPDEMDESWRHGALLGGMAQVENVYQLANSFKLAGDRLMTIALENEEVQDLFYPAIYNYRHATELYMKAVLHNSKRSHDLDKLLQQLRELLKQDFNATLSTYFEQVILTFKTFDPYGTAFRYGDTAAQNPAMGTEAFVDFAHVQSLMGKMAAFFSKMRHQQGYPDARII